MTTTAVPYYGNDYYPGDTQGHLLLPDELAAAIATYQEGIYELSRLRPCGCCPTDPAATRRRQEQIDDAMLATEFAGVIAADLFAQHDYLLVVDDWMLTLGHGGVHLAVVPAWLTGVDADATYDPTDDYDYDPDGQDLDDDE